jgi:CRP-like cAMP-binding protein
MSTNMVHAPQPPNFTLVQQSRLFSSLPQSVLQEMVEKFRIEGWPKNALVESNILTERFYILLEGQLEIKQSNPDTGREVTLDMLFKGDCFDVICLLDKQPRDIILTPLTELKLISVPINTMRHWLWSYPLLNQEFLPYLGRKMRTQEELTTSIALHDISTRLSRILLKHIDRIKAYTGEPAHAHEDHLINGYSDDVLARMVGSVRQVVNKQLQYWKSQGILNKKRNQLMILDLEELKKAANLTLDSL